MPMDWDGNGPPFQAWGEMIQGVVSLLSQLSVPTAVTLVAAAAVVGTVYLLTRRKG